MGTKRTLCALLAVFLFVNSYADVITKTYHFSNPAVKQFGNYHILKLKNTRLTGISGEPTLPYAAVRLLLPPGHAATEITIERQNPITVSENFKAYPYQPSQPISKPDKAAFQKNRDVYRSAEAYPAKAEGKINTEFLRGHAVALSAFTPASYFPSEKKLLLYQTVTITIHTEASAKANEALAMLHPVKDKSSFQNSENFSKYQYSLSRDGNYDYLIITDEEFSGSFEELKSFYLDRGYLAEVITTQDIESEMSGDDLQEKIRNYIIQEYQQSAVEYVLLGGDVEYIPYRGFFCQVQSSSLYEDDDIPADLYYSALDGNWNTDGDNLWAEPDEDDLLPEVSVGRLPFSTQTELEKMLNKTMSFQGNPVVGELAKPFLAGEHLYDDPETWGSDYMELHIGFHDDNGYETEGIPEGYNYETLYASEVGYWSGQDIMDNVNEGKTQLYHVGHANTSTVMNLYTSDITNENFYGANGVDHTFTNIYTHGCICGSFDASDCIGEEMVKIDNFAASFIGNSRYGWFNEGQTEGPSQHIHREFTDELYGSDNLRIGKAHKVSKDETSPWVEAPGQWEEGALRWCFYDCNVLGDPAMAMWTSEPLETEVNYPAAFQIGTLSIEVEISLDGDALEGYRCVLKQEGEILGIGISNENGTATIEINNGLASVGEAELLVSGNNMLLTTFPIDVIPNEGAYILLEEYTLNDENTNGTIENGESSTLDITLENVGTEDAEDVSTVLSSEDEYVTITDNSADFGLIGGESNATVVDAFAFEVQDGIPDQHEITFLITASSGESWTSDFEIIGNAPELVIGDLGIDDSDGGNGNGYLDPDEEVVLTLDNQNNGHNNAFGLTGTLSALSGYISIEENQQELPYLNTGEPVSTSYIIHVSEDAETGMTVTFNYNLSNSAYEATAEFTHSIGIVGEGFETGDYTAMEWELQGDMPWQICDTEAYAGNYCSQSGDISDNQQSEMNISVTVQADDTVSFYRKVSSESNYDYLQFFIDDELIGEWSGEEDWGYVSYAVSEGEHTFSWIFDKDGSVSGGNDCAWIDEIVFPPMTLPTELENPAAFVNEIQIYPNPARNKIFINTLHGQLQKAQMTIISQSGKVIYSQEISNSNAPVEINLSKLPSGVYTVLLRERESVFRKKFIKIN